MMKKPNVTENEIYTIQEACKALGIDRRTLRRYANAGCITMHIRTADNRIVFFGQDILKCYSDVR